MIPDNITREHVFRAVREIDHAGVPPKRFSKKFLLVVGNRTYPPKYVLSLANLYANGEMLDPESFGGGEETNGFLMELGFIVQGPPTASDGPTQRVRTAALTVLRAKAPADVTIARVILDVGATRKAFHRYLDDGWNLWEAHEGLITKEFRRDPNGYRERIGAVLGRALERAASHVLLPACALLHEPAGGIEPWLALARSVPWLVTGVMALGTGQDGSGSEDAVVLERGAIAERFPPGPIHWFDTGACTTMAAISSSIDALTRQGAARSTRHPPRSGAPAVILDMGHTQYSSRYTRIMNRVVKEARRATGRPSLLAVAYWRYSDTRPTSWWVVPKEPWWEADRDVVESGSGASRREDLVDLLRVQFLR